MAKPIEFTEKERRVVARAVGGVYSRRVAKLNILPASRDADEDPELQQLHTILSKLRAARA
jgi:hypothetical protein